MIALRLKIGVSDKEVIPACRHLIFTDTNGAQANFTIQTIVEDFGDLPRWGYSRMHVFNNNGKRTRSPSPIRSQPPPLIGSGPGTDPGASSSSFFTQPLQFLPSNPSNPNPTNPIHFAQPPHLNAQSLPTINPPREPSPIPVINPIPDPIPEPIIDPVPPLADPNPIPEPIIDPVPPQADPQSVIPPVPQPIPPPLPQLADPILRQIPEEPLPVDNLEALRDAIPVQDPPPPPPRAAQIRGSAQPTVSEEARHSLCLKAKEGAAKKKGDKSGATSGNVIISTFPYVHLNDLELI